MGANNLKVLIVDDYKTMLRIIKNLLKQLSITDVTEATDGQMALDILVKDNSFDLIISDWNMEPVTGLQLLNNVRKSEELKHIPFIMVTAESKAENVIAAKEAGISNYIVKPFNATILKEKIFSVIDE